MNQSVTSPLYGMDSLINEVQTVMEKTNQVRDNILSYLYVQGESDIEEMRATLDISAKELDTMLRELERGNLINRGGHWASLTSKGKKKALKNEETDEEQDESLEEASVGDKHQKKIAIDTVKNPMKGSILGGMSEKEAIKLLKTKFGYSDDQIKKLQKEETELDEATDGQKLKELQDRLNVLNRMAAKQKSKGNLKAIAKESQEVSQKIEELKKKLNIQESGEPLEEADQDWKAGKTSIKQDDAEIVRGEKPYQYILKKNGKQVGTATKDGDTWSIPQNGKTLTFGSSQSVMKYIKRQKLDETATKEEGGDIQEAVSQKLMDGIEALLYAIMAESLGTGKKNQASMEDVEQSLVHDFAIVDREVPKIIQAAQKINFVKIQGGNFVLTDEALEFVRQREA